MQSDSLLQVDLAAIGRNAEAFKRLAGGGTACCGIVKADAYGLGAVRVSTALIDAGIDLLAVFRVEEALDLLREQVAVPVLVLGPMPAISSVHPLMAALLDGRAEVVLHDARTLRELERAAGSGAASIRVHVEVDVGMRRGGVAAEDAPTLLAAVAASPVVELAGVMAQFSSAASDPELTRREDARLRAAIHLAGGLPTGCRVHAAATAATIRDTALHHDLVRIGLGWSGTVPGDTAMAGSCALQLTPAVRWRSRITHVHHVRAGSAVGYGGLWTAGRDTTIGIVPVGYADGIPHSAGATSGSGGASIAVMKPRDRGGVPARHAPIVGAVSMDQCAIDLGMSGAVGESLVGRAVEVISAVREGPSSLAGFAEACAVSPHQLLVGISPRVRRVGVSRLKPSAEHSDWSTAEAV